MSMMTDPPVVRGKFYALRAVALALVVFAGVIFLQWPDRFAIRSLGLLSILVSVWLVRRSSEYIRRARGQMIIQRSLADRSRRIGRFTWILTGASLVACGIFYVVMYLDALHGGKEGWPAYAFGCAALTLALTTGTIAAKLFR